MKAAPTKNRFIRILWIGVIILALIGITAVVRRILLLEGLIKSPPYPRGGAFDSGFSRHPVLTLFHIIPGIFFMVCGPLQFSTKIRNRYPRFHTWCKWIFIGSSVQIGITALIMAFTMAIGGANETSATALFASLFLFSLYKSVLYNSRQEYAYYREWMIRVFAIGLAIATVRPIVGMFFAFSKLLPQEFFGIAFWIGFTIHLIIAEAWINYTRKNSDQVTTKNVV